MTTQEERISRLEGAYEHLATKADIEGVNARIAEVETGIANLRADLTTRIAEVETKVADMKADLTWRVAGLQLAGLAAVAAIMGFLR